MDERNKNVQLPWVEKYRPHNFEDIISQKNIVNTISNLIESGKLPHLLFHGPPGTGKTSLILACARKIYGENCKLMVLELNSSDERGINIVRNQIKEFASSKHFFGKGIKIIILDEADSMTYDAQFALRRVIERYTYNTRFCLICNYLTKIIPALQARCMQFRFSPLKSEQIFNKLKYVCEKEKITYDNEGIMSIVKLSQGDMRRCFNLLQSVNMSFKNEINITKNNVYECAGNPLPKDMKQIFDWLLNETYSEAFNKIYKLKEEKGLALIDIIEQITELIIEHKFSEEQYIELFKGLATIEQHLSTGTSEFIQLASFVGEFVKIRYIK